ncbi:hypothetical protein SAMN04488518_104334 [Pseudovibrio ascidiaceicola]|uniref:Uncharacterized protein n=1 Tax=Pseudovibrio ascidiaceicola TaxID=285279 RepID=A0A1I3YZX5_9HYPH|nr:hypothetical protein SAMN04488518_104334 [Pseudovibrio ascidiaceicola]
MDTGGDFYSDMHAQRHWESFEDWWWCVESSRETNPRLVQLDEKLSFNNYLKLQ